MDISAPPSAAPAAQTEASTAPATASAEVEAAPLSTEQIGAAEVNIDKERYEHAPAMGFGTTEQINQAQQNLHAFVIESSPKLKSGIQRLVEQIPEVASVVGVLKTMQPDLKSSPELKKALKAARGLEADEALATIVRAASKDGQLKPALSKLRPEEAKHFAQGLERLANELERPKAAAPAASRAKGASPAPQAKRSAEYERVHGQSAAMLNYLEPALSNPNAATNWQDTKAQMSASSPEAAALIRAVETKALIHHAAQHGSGAKSEAAREAQDAQRLTKDKIRRQLEVIAAESSRHLSARDQARMRRVVNKIYNHERKGLLGNKRWVRRSKIWKELRELQLLQSKIRMRERTIKGRLTARKGGEERAALKLRHSKKRRRIK